MSVATILIAMPLLNSLSTPLGAVICLVAFLAMLLDSRQIRPLREMGCYRKRCRSWHHMPA